MIGPALAGEDVLVRSPANPLIGRGPAGSFDQLKIGPRAILREGPTNWKMWYEGVPDGNQASVGYATSPDGVHWTKYSRNPIMIPSEPWEGGPKGEISPNTVLKEEGIYKMWYHGFRDGVRRIGYATSTDGLNWKKYTGNPVLDVGPPGSWEALAVVEPKVIKVGSKYYMWYSGQSGTEFYGQNVGLATSADGIHWTKYPGNPVLRTGPRGAWDDKSVMVGDIVWDGSVFHDWYHGNQFAPKGGIGYAKSADGINWTKSPNNPILVRPTDKNLPDAYGVGGGMNALRVGDEWYIYYSCMVFCCPENMSVCLATAHAAG